MTITALSSVGLSSSGYAARLGQLQSMIVSFDGRLRNGGVVDGGQAVEVQATNRADAIFQVRQQYIVAPDSAINVNVLRGPGESPI